jgi:hypothetical protein
VNYLGGDLNSTCASRSNRAMRAVSWAKVSESTLIATSRLRLVTHAGSSDNL